MKRVLLALFVLVALPVVLLPTPTLHAQDDTDWCAPALSPTLASGDVAANTIDDTNYVWSYCFDGNAGDEVTLTATATSGDLDTYLAIFDEDFTTALAENDDITDSNTNSRITYRLPQDGRYIIGVTRFGLEDGTTSGSFALTLDIKDPNTPTDTNPDALNICESPNSRTIAIGQSQSGTITDDAFVIGFCIEVNAGDVLVVETEATAGDLDTKVLISDPTFEEIFAENDDIALDNSNAALTFTVPFDGEFVIAVTRFEEREGRTSGDFDVRLLRGDAELVVDIAAQNFGSFGVPIRMLDDTASVVNSGEATNGPNLCGNTIIAELVENDWEPLTGLGGIYSFTCAGRVTYVGGASGDSGDNGTFTLEDDVLTMTLAGRTIVWREFLLVAGLITATDENGTEIYYVSVPE